MTVDDSSRDYWQKKYKEIPNELGPYADDREVSASWMRAKGLRYVTQDGGGPYWISRVGDKYYFDRRAEGSKPDDDRDASNNSASAMPGYTAAGSTLLNTNPVTATPLTFWPTGGQTAANDPAYDDIPQTAGIGKYSKQSIKKMALGLPCVQVAINEGKRVQLHMQYNVNGKPKTAKLETIAAGDKSLFSEPIDVTFKGSFKSDGSVEPGTKITCSASCGDVKTEDGSSTISGNYNNPGISIGYARQNGITNGNPVTEGRSVVLSSNDTVTGGKSSMLNMTPRDTVNFTQNEPMREFGKYYNIADEKKEKCKISRFHIVPLKKDDKKDKASVRDFLDI